MINSSSPTAIEPTTNPQRSFDDRKRIPSRSTRGRAADARERRAVQECRVPAENQLHQILEDRLFDLIAVEFERHAVEPVHVHQRHRHDSGLIIDPEGDSRRDRGRDGKGTLADAPVRRLHASARVLESRVIERLLGDSNHAGRDLERNWFGRGDFVVDADLVQDRETDDAVLVLSNRAVSESWRLEYQTVPQVEPVIDRRLEPAQIRHRLFQPAKRLAQPRIDRLEALDVGVLLGRFARQLVLSAQLIKERTRLVHRQSWREVSRSASSIQPPPIARYRFAYDWKSC